MCERRFFVNHHVKVDIASAPAAHDRRHLVIKVDKNGAIKLEAIMKQKKTFRSSYPSHLSLISWL